jgi:hypothetical protein
MFENVVLNDEEKKIMQKFLPLQEIEEYSEIEFIDTKCKCGSENFDFDFLMDDKVCIECGLIQNYTSSNIGFVQYNQINKIKPSIYKPLAHMRIILEEMSCKRVNVCDDMICKIKHALGNKKVTYKNVKKLLRKLGYTQHYLQMPCILNQIDQKRFPSLKMSSNQIDKIESFFKLFIQVYFSLSLKERQNRKNVINYHYILKKICMKLKYNHVLPYLHPPDLKTIKKLDCIWDLIVQKEPTLG